MANLIRFTRKNNDRFIPETLKRAFASTTSKATTNATN